MPSKPVSLNLSVELVEMLDRAAHDEGRSRSGMAERILFENLNGRVYITAGAEFVVPARGTDLSSVKPDPKP